MRRAHLAETTAIAETSQLVGAVQTSELVGAVQTSHLAPSSETSETSELVMVDLFSGRGGASAAMRERGWRVVSLDVSPAFRPSIVADVSALPLRELRPDLLWCSPPCDEFSDAAPGRWTSARATAPSLTLVYASLEAVRRLRPRFWVLENVRGALPWLGLAPRSWGPFYLWGYFPPFRGAGRKGLKETRRVRSASARARIPYELSHAVAVAVEAYRGRCLPGVPLRTARAVPQLPFAAETTDVETSVDETTISTAPRR